ncbi:MULTISPECIES: helix-turn-helix domain-containing protein [Flavobacterium]|jgi:AraC-like DNA-binding protein|uniref:AraC family transcriptional regulator n=1 Tax=Flavobacterium algoritolerans TaxID=3041254 RepID=A0ABT6VH34_9FLAO|nr:MULTISPECIES: AraC family transcriptional regulator [Flavobacterium]MDI5889189.1 AraC family transcriptional regulator [Flavobacterium yafengii]MDI5896317.1 AraC family transcriptional regulator [Flavobacterium algoritolerans]
MILFRKRYELFGKIIFEKVIIEAPFKIPNPMPEEACFIYMVEGQIKYEIENKSITIPVNDAVMLKCGNYFSQIRNSEISKNHEIVIVHFHPEILKKIYDTDLPKIFQEPVKRDLSLSLGKINNDFLIQKYIEGMLFYFDNPTLVNDDILVIKLKEIVLLLCQTKNAPVIQQILSQLFSPTSYSFKQVIENNLYSHFTTDEFAQMTNLSLSSFKREFKKNYNDSPANYIRNKKLDKAAELLLISEERITDIAFDCGFNDLANFSTLFHDKFNCAPSAYRLNQIGKLLN